MVVVDSDDPVTGERRRHPRVVPPQVAHAHDRETDFLHL
jgi:hypothetical protein